MKSKLIIAGVLAAALSGMVANACNVQVTVACPGAGSASGIKVCLSNPAGKFPTVCQTTDSTGFVNFDNVSSSNDYIVCVDPTTLPKNATLGTVCQSFSIPAYGVLTVNLQFDLGGSFCNGKPQGLCWMTGGGEIRDGNGAPIFSYGGVVYPGCSPKAADGGNWNTDDHNTGIHFQGKHVVVDSCSGVGTRSPKTVDVNIIDFHGDGIVSGIAGNPTGRINVTFTGRVVDNHDGGAGADLLYLQVTDGTTIWLQIGDSAASPQVVSTGNLQIHISSCGK